MTERFERTLESKPVELGHDGERVDRAQVADDDPPEAVTAARIWAGVVPGANRTTVTPKGLPAAEADPVIASAAANVARRRVGRFTVEQASADRSRFLHHSF